MTGWGSASYPQFLSIFDDAAPVMGPTSGAEASLSAGAFPVGHIYVGAFVCFCVSVIQNILV